IPDFGRIVSMMQFNMYHHYTVDEHLLRCIGVLAEIETGSNPDYGLANELARTIQPEHREMLYVALFLHDIAKGRIEDHSIAGAHLPPPRARRSGPPPPTPGRGAGRTEHPPPLPPTPQPPALPARRTIENFSPIVQSLERMKLLTILTTA